VWLAGVGEGRGSGAIADGGELAGVAQMATTVHGFQLRRHGEKEERERRPRWGAFHGRRRPTWARQGRQWRELTGAHGNGPSDHQSRRWRHGKKEGSEAKLTEQKNGAEAARG
jgi:hypothetical protein